MKKSILILLTVISLGEISFVACNKKDEMNNQDNLDILFEFSVFNSQNKDLLDTATINHYNSEEIKLLYEVDGEVYEVYDKSLDYPRNFVIYKHEDEYRMRISMNYTESSEKPITYIKWNNNDTDTIKTVYERYGNSVLKRKVWLNEVLIWDWTTNKDEYNKLVK